MKEPVSLVSNKSHIKAHDNFLAHIALSHFSFDTNTRLFNTITLKVLYFSLKCKYIALYYSLVLVKSWSYKSYSYWMPQFICCCGECLWKADQPLSQPTALSTNRSLDQLFTVFLNTILKWHSIETAIVRFR